MTIDSMQDSTRYVVSGLHHGSVLPGSRLEMSRHVYLVENADVRGGIWSTELEVRGANISVTESVFCQNSMTVMQDEKKRRSGKKNPPVEFGSCVVVGDSLVVNELPYRVRFRSDVFARTLNLDNAIVLGNIYADNVVLKNSVVLGGVFCKNRIELNNCMVSTFRAKNVEIGDSVYLFFPFAVSEQPMVLNSPVQALTFFNIYQDIRPDEAEKTDQPGGVVELDGDDIYEVSDNQVIPFSKDAENTEENDSGESEEKKVYVISGSERILDTMEISRNFQFNRRFMEILTLGNHMKPKAREELFNGPLEDLEEYLWKIIDSNTKLEPVTGATRLEDLFRRADVLAAMDQTVRGNQTHEKNAAETGSQEADNELKLPEDEVFGEAAPDSSVQDAKAETDAESELVQASAPDSDDIKKEEISAAPDSKIPGTEKPPAIVIEFDNQEED